MTHESRFTIFDSRFVRVGLPAIGSALTLATLFPGAAHGQPQVPASFYGTVSADGRPVPDGVAIRAFVDGNDCTQPGARGALRQGETTVYILNVMHESQAAGCGAEGKTVAFRIGDRPAAQLASWRPGLQHLDLNAGLGEPAPLPTDSGSTPNDAERLATATEQAKFTPKAGEPPTDNVTFGRTPIPGGEQKPAAGDVGGGVSPLLVLGVAALVLAALGAAGGFALSRRSRPRGTDRS